MGWNLKGPDKCMSSAGQHVGLCGRSSEVDLETSGYSRCVQPVSASRLLRRDAAPERVRLRQPRESCVMPDFLAFCPGVPLQNPRSRVFLRCGVRRTAHRVRLLPRAALLAVELAAATGGDAHGAERACSALPRVGPHFLLYVGAEPREALTAAVESAGWPEGDAVCGPGGLFQKRYATPDPLWAKKCWGAWDPAPARWVVQEFFGERMTERKGTGPAASRESGELFEDGEMEVTFEVAEDGGELMTVRDDLEVKLQEMGVAGSVGLRGGSGSGGTVVVRPSGAPPGEIVRFCAEMLQKRGEEVLVFGSSSFVNASLAAVGNGARGVVPAGDVAAEGVFAAAGEGGEAFVQGLQHFGFVDASKR